MSVVVDERSRVVIQGVTGGRGRRAVAELREYGTNVVAGVSPGHAGEDVDGVPIFDFVADAVSATAADTSLVLVPGLPYGKDAVLEAALGGIAVAVWIADPVPLLDMVRLKAAIGPSGLLLVGPNSPGVISPGKAVLGFMPKQCYLPGSIGVISKSGSLSYEVCLRMTRAGLGQSTVIGIGGDPIKGLDLDAAVTLLENDHETTSMLIIGEAGGLEESWLAERVTKRGLSKPMAALLVGANAPPGTKMGHAGALVMNESESAAAKIASLRAAGVATCTSPTSVVDTMVSVLPAAR